MDDFILNLNSDWKIAYEENYKCKDYADDIYDIKTLKSKNLPEIDGTVPGNFELDLYKNNIIEDPFFGLNPIKMQDWENRHVWYYTQFELNDIDGTEYIKFEGIDTIADIYFNSELIATVDNMYISHEIPLYNANVGKNELLVHIKPATIFARNYEIPPSSNAQEYAYDSLYLRKAPHMFGWDIMPRLVSCGIWKPVKIFKRKSNRINDIFIYTTAIDVNNNFAQAALFFTVSVSNDLLKDYYLEVDGKCDGSQFSFKKRLWHTQGHFKFNINDCMFWWPKNAGLPNLYDTNIKLYYKDQLCDTYKINFGVRTIELDRTNTTDKEGNGEFCFKINGKKVFCMGTNWVPVDAFHSNDINRLPKALEMVNELGCNIIRCWGGNVYEDDYFFDFCDKHGIMVWQDFAMGCAVYPQEQLFYDMLENEAIHIIKRLRNHASLVLWAGDNEGDYAYQDWGGIKRNPDNNILTREILSRICEAHDFTRPYLPSSPYITAESFFDGKPTSEEHLWGPRDYFKGTYYKNSVCHFASETGYHGCPSPSTLKRFISKEELWPCFKDDGLPKDEWEAHSTCMELIPNVAYSYRIRLMERQVNTLFGKDEANDLNNFAKQSQISQAEAKKYFIERFRVSKWRRTGIIWWNLLDGWPQISDAVVDYYFTKKLAYHYIKRSQNPICLIFDEPVDNSISLYGINDTDNNIDITYVVKNVTKENIILLEGKACIYSNSSVKINNVNIDKDDKSFYLIEWNINGKTYKNHYYTNIIDINYDNYIKALAECGFDEFEGFDEKN